ncbi:hypothetical protein GUJ93_ZPchr0004g39406 [Zizania palustris]|uniref:Uncharacterized protein n=1 Tax=Zizania palustris TaxID=103762 RepID=A0A8J5VFX7_ZIZPA|nr:hypothetical protein GUJ93_ZPchr0004g39406 [Zizania palustris]
MLPGRHRLHAFPPPPRASTATTTSDLLLLPLQSLPPWDPNCPGSPPPPPPERRAVEAMEPHVVGRGEGGEGDRCLRTTSVRLPDCRHLQSAPPPTLT